jgi:hypothetical protein
MTSNVPFCSSPHRNLHLKGVICSLNMVSMRSRCQVLKAFRMINRSVLVLIAFVNKRIPSPAVGIDYRSSGNVSGDHIHECFCIPVIDLHKKNSSLFCSLDAGYDPNPFNPVTSVIFSFTELRFIYLDSYVGATNDFIFLGKHACH